ncbi:MAG TPA: peptidoglycan DD-metalloendopeptidase family protein [Ktedonobacteraceae bacterium]
MTSAIDLINNPELAITPLTVETSASRGYTSSELAHFRIGQDDIKNLVFNIYGFGGVRGTTVKTNIRPSVTDAVFEDSIDKTNTFTLTVHDPDWELLNTGALQEVIDLNPGKIPKLWYRLDSFTVNDDTITLVFATRNAVYLSYHHHAYKASRKRVTRAQFILSMLRKVKITKIPFHCPQLNVRQPVATQTESEIAAQNHRAPGFTASDKITVGGQTANQTQRDCISEVIRAGVAAAAPGLVIVSAICCVEVESVANTNVGVYSPSHPYKGAFQQNPKYGWPATGNVYKDALGYYKAAIPKFRKNPNVDMGLFVQSVQGAYGGVNWDYPFKINKHRQEAQHAYNAYNTGIPVNDPGSGQVEVVGNYEFGIGLKDPDGGVFNESYLAAAYRLADKVGWSFFWVRDTAYYMSEHDMFKAKSRARLRRGVHGVESVNFTWDQSPTSFDENFPRGASQHFNQMTLSVRMDKWVCPLGTVVNFDEGGPAEGKWLVTNIRRSMFDSLGEIILSKPIKEKKEPLVKTTKNVATGSNPANDSTGNVPSTGEWDYPLEVRGRLIGFPNDPGSTHDPHVGSGRGGYLWQDDNAVDIACPVGTHEYAVDDGVFFNVGGFYHDGSGRYEGLKFSIRTKDNEVFYQHSSWRAPWVQNGAKVQKGQYIARTGKGAGVPHLHFACKNGNPQVLIGQANEVVTSGGVWPGLYIVTSPFGEPRSYEIHHGCDVGVPYNTKCIAPFAGTVTFAENDGFDPGGAGGGMVHLRLDNNQAGLSAGDKIGWGHAHNMQVHAGQKVRKGTVLAYSNGSPAHVHFVLIRPGHGGNGIDGNSDPFPFLQRIGSAYEH